MTAAESPELPAVRLTNGNPIAILGACKRVALKAGWPLRRWVEFRESVQACLSPEATDEEHARFLAVVGSFFVVELAPGFSPDPTFTPHPEDTHD